MSISLVLVDSVFTIEVVVFVFGGIHFVALPSADVGVLAWATQSPAAGPLRCVEDNEGTPVSDRLYGWRKYLGPDPPAGAFMSMAGAIQCSLYAAFPISCFLILFRRYVGYSSGEMWLQRVGC